MTVIGIGGLASGGTVGEVGFAAVTSYRNGGTVAAVIGISLLTFGSAVAEIFFAAVRGVHGGTGITGINASLADVGRTDGNKPGFAGTGFITGFAVDGKVVGTGRVGGDTETTAIHRTGEVVAVTGTGGSGIGTGSKPGLPVGEEPGCGELERLFRNSKGGVVCVCIMRRGGVSRQSACD